MQQVPWRDWTVPGAWEQLRRNLKEMCCKGGEWPQQRWSGMEIAIFFTVCWRKNCSNDCSLFFSGWHRGWQRELAEILQDRLPLQYRECIGWFCLKKDRGKGKTHSENSSQLFINILLLLPSPLSPKHRQYTDSVSLQKSQPTTSASHIETQGKTEGTLTVTFCSTPLRTC